MKKRAQPKVRVYTGTTEFFADRKVVIESHETLEEQIALLHWLVQEDKENPHHNEEAIARKIEEYSARANAETKHLKEAKEVLDKAADLRRRINQGELHGSIWAAMLLQQAYMRLLLRQREPDAQSGREMKESNTKAANNRWQATAVNRERRNKDWEIEANRLRAAHPDWSQNEIGRHVKKNTHAKESLRTILGKIL